MYIHIYDTIREANVDHMFSRGYIYTLYIFLVVCLGVCFVVCLFGFLRCFESLAFVASAPMVSASIFHSRRHA